jgi:hypothetical protein
MLVLGSSCSAPRALRVAQRTAHRTAGGPRVMAASRAMESKTAGVGQKLGGSTHKACIYLDYNATTPIFPEVPP